VTGIMAAERASDKGTGKIPATWDR
jgi:hypothetical protein